MREIFGWADLAVHFGAIKTSGLALSASWFAFVGSENYGVWLLHPDDAAAEWSRARFCYLAARAIELAGAVPIPAPDPRQYCPAHAKHKSAEQQQSSSVTSQRDIVAGVPSGLSAVDACTRAWLELLKRESISFDRNPTGQSTYRDAENDLETTCETTSGSIQDLCEASEVYCMKRATADVELGLSVVGASNSRRDDRRHLAPVPVTKAARPATDIKARGDSRPEIDLTVPILEFQYPYDLPAGRQLRIEQAARDASEEFRRKRHMLKDLFARDMARRAWFLSVVSAAAAEIGAEAAAAKPQWDVNRRKSRWQDICVAAAAAAFVDYSAESRNHFRDTDQLKEGESLLLRTDSCDPQSDSAPSRSSDVLNRESPIRTHRADLPKDPSIALLDQVLDRQQITLERWASEHKFGRTTFFDWKAGRSAGTSLKGRVSPDKADEIESAIRADAEALGLSARTGSD